MKWKTTEHEGEKDRLVVSESGELIADCFAPSTSDFSLPEDYRRNAHLIAAAPELLEALQAFIDCQTPPITWSAQGCMAKSRAAIKKAAQ